MRSVAIGSDLGSVMVITTNGRGATPAEVADRALSKIIHVSETANPLIRDQALAYREAIRDVLEYYMTEAVNAEKTNIRNRMRAAGCSELIPVVLGE